MMAEQDGGVPKGVLMEMRGHIEFVRSTGGSLHLAAFVLEGEFGSLKAAQQWFMAEGAVLVESDRLQEKRHGMLRLALLPEAIKEQAT